MKRRQVLALVVSSTVGLSGCIAIQSDSNDGQRDSAGDEVDDSSNEMDSPESGPPDEESPTIPDPTGECGPASLPPAERLTADPGGDCDDDAEPQLALMNDWSEQVSARVTIETNDETVFERTFVLGPDEYTTVDPGIPVVQMETVTASIEDRSAYAASWPNESCKLHAVAITPDGIEAGYLDPVSGTGGLPRCYAGEAHEVELHNRTMDYLDVTITAVDHCAEVTRSISLEINPQGTRLLDLSLAIGGIYTIVGEVHGGGADTYELEDSCGKVEIEIEEKDVVDVSIQKGY